MSQNNKSTTRKASLMIWINFLTQVSCSPLLRSHSKNAEREEGKTEKSNEKFSSCFCYSEESSFAINIMIHFPKHELQKFLPTNIHGSSFSFICLLHRDCERKVFVHFMKPSMNANLGLSTSFSEVFGIAWMLRSWWKNANRKGV